MSLSGFQEKVVLRLHDLASRLIFFFLQFQKIRAMTRTG
jgi:hypothetical protein